MRRGTNGSQSFSTGTPHMAVRARKMRGTNITVKVIDGNPLQTYPSTLWIPDQHKQFPQ